MANTLVDPVDLESFPGAPFDADLVDIAAASVRAEAGWHIAPQVTETLTVDCYGGTLLILPTRRIVAVTAVRDITDGAVVLADWKRMAGGLYRRNGWPIGVLEVDLTHGYAETPADLFAVIAQRVKSNSIASNVSQRSVTRGPFSESETFRDEKVSSTDPIVARYAVHAGIA